jgi:hypothetical protein
MHKIDLFKVKKHGILGCYGLNACYNIIDRLLSIRISSRLNHPKSTQKSQLHIVVVVGNLISQFNTIF